MAGGGLIGKLRVWIGVDNSDYKKGLDQSKQQTSTFAKEVGGTLKSIGAAFAIGAVIKKAFDFSRESYRAMAQAQGVERAFARLNDPSLLNNLKAATKGTVDEMKLMQVAVQAKNFKIPIENLVTYLKFAKTRADETGESVDYLVQSIVLGVGRRSPLILDNLGIGLKETREEFAKTGDMAKAVSNIIEREMSSTNDIVETSKDLAGQSEAAWKNVYGTVGKLSTIKSVGDFFNRASASIANFIIKIADSTRKIGENETAVRNESIEVNRLIATVTKSNATNEERAIAIAKLNEIQPKVVEGINAENVATKKLIETAKEYNREIVARIALAQRQDDVAGAVTRQLEAGTGVMNKEAKIAEFLLSLQSDLSTVDLERGYLNMSQGLTKWRKITSEERTKIASEYSDIITSTKSWGEKISEAYKLFSNSPQSLEKIRGVSLKPFFRLGEDLRDAQKELTESGNAAETAKQDVEKFKQTFSQLFETVAPKGSEKLTESFVALVAQIHLVQSNLSALQEKAQKDGFDESIISDIKSTEEELAVLSDKYETLTGKKFGAKVKVETDKDQLKNAAEGSIAYFENEISKRQLLLKLSTDDASIKKWQKEIVDFEAIIKAKIEVKSSKTERQVIEDAIKGYEDQQLALSIGMGSPEEMATAQAEWDRLAGIIKQAREELDKFPKTTEIFPEGSLGHFDAKIAELTKGLDKLTGAESAAAQAQIALLNAQKQGVESGYSTEIGVLTAQLSLYESQIETTTGKVREYWEALANDTRTAIAGLGDDLLEWGGLIQSGISEAMRGLGDAIGSGNLDEALQQGILSPMASMLGQLGEQLIAMGIAKLNLDAWAVPFSGPGMIAAGAALVALSQVAQSAMAKTVGSMGQSGGNANTFTGGYSYGSNSPSYATTNGVSRSSEQTIVVKGEVSGDKLRFVLDKDAMRRKS